MQFRCPNCQHAIKVEESGFSHEEETLDGIECPSCHSHFNLSGDAETTVSAEKGKKIAHFEIQSVLGEGSFGTVYRALDTELNRMVAIKVPRAGRVSSKTSKLFLREAQSAARVTHPNVVSVFEVGKHEDLFYIASEYIDGISLAEYLKERSLPQREAVQLLVKVLRGVDAFHQQGIVHRDLKPGNILLDGDNEPHITDFGLARHESENAITVTQNGDIFGTPVYMPPEQARGDIQNIDHRSDVYAVGVMLYQLLTGKKPFKASSSRTLLYSIQHDDPAKLRSIAPKTPRELETVCHTAIEKDSAARYQSASEMADDLERWLDGRPIHAKPAGPVTRITKWVKRHKALTAALLLGLCSLALASTLLLDTQEPIPDNMTAAMLKTTPAFETARYIRLDELTRQPHENNFEVVIGPDERAVLQPGLYKVIASAADGAFHEVWRTVPAPDDAIGQYADYPHQFATRNEDGTVQLPEFRLFHERDVSEPLVLQIGGTFEMGLDERPANPAGKHSQTVADFLIGIREVSRGRFRDIMKSHDVPDGSGTNWLSFLKNRFGDESDLDENLPVTGYPIDVAILYCELVGGRLPTHVEYEYAATVDAKDKDAGAAGSEPEPESTSDWKILPVNAPTTNQSEIGVQNLFASVAEYTASSTLNYVVLYPDKFQDDFLKQFKPPTLSSEMGRMIQDSVEVRGAPGDWVRKGDSSASGSPRERIKINRVQISKQPFTGEQKASSASSKKEKEATEEPKAPTAVDRTGWRVYRSTRTSLQNAEKP